MTVKFDLEDMRYFADRYRGKYKTSGPHWSLVNRFPVLFDEYERLQGENGILKTEYDLCYERLVETENKLTESLNYAAKWIENSLIGETNERVIEFGKNMAMSIRAAEPTERGRYEQ